jgi:heat shock protein HspQ
VKKKIALMTWHHVNNYGTALQAFALKSVIINLGYDVDLINYRRTAILPLRRRTIMAMVKVYLHQIGSRLHKKQINNNMPSKSFEAFFNNNFTYTGLCKHRQDFNELNGIYDGFVCGSDQIWGPEWFDPHYYFDFVTDHDRLIAYAPSLAVSHIEEVDTMKEMTKYISRFRYLSVRESTGQRLVQEMTSRVDVVNSIDPVFLLTSSDWNQIASDKVDVPNRYMLIFFLKNNQAYFEAAMHYAYEMNLSPVILHCTQSEDNAYANIENPSLNDFLAYIREADYVCTDSFHVVAFAIIYNVSFKCFQKNRITERNEKNSRITDLLNKLGISSAEYQTNTVCLKIDYSGINTVLEEWKLKSNQYLFNALLNLPERQKSVIKYDCDLSDSKYCSAQIHSAYYDRLSSASQNEKKLLQKIAESGFIFEEKCYECRNNIKYANVRKPIFYEQLIMALKNKKSAKKIYHDYCLAYTFPQCIKKIFIKTLINSK